MRPMIASAVPGATVPVRSGSSHVHDGAAAVAREPLLLLLRQPEPEPAPPPRARGDEACRGGAAGTFPWLPAAAFCYLTFSSAMALHRSRGDPGAVAFVAFAYLDLVLLSCCLRRYERAEPGSALRGWLKRAVWLLTAALTLLFSYKVAAAMPPAVAALVWAVGLATSAGGFVALFCLKTPPQEPEQSPPPDSPVSDLKQIARGPRWPSPTLVDPSSLCAHTAIAIEPSRSAYGVISP